ncbi:MAG: EthD family reductase [Chloroflexota bacterium]
MFKSLQDFQQAFGPHAGELMADIPNFTNIEPVIQISDITLS